jgi:hypothetical protein
MRSTTRLVLTSFVLLASAAVTACGRDEAQAPPAATETEVSRRPNTPATVTGCLRAGDAAGTFVLTTSQTADATTPATYHLTGASDVNLQDHIGKRVEVSGVVEAQSQIATREAPKPADNATGTAGTSGTPTVQTNTALSVRRLNVTSIKRTDGECEM